MLQQLYDMKTFEPMDVNNLTFMSVVDVIVCTEPRWLGLWGNAQHLNHEGEQRDTWEGKVIADHNPDIK